MPSGLGAETEVPAHLADARWAGPIHEVGSDEMLVAFPKVGRALIRRDRPPTVAPSPGADPADVEWFRRRLVREATDVFAGRFGLRAAVVEIAGAARALVGPGGAGKSFVAADLARRGHPVLADSYLPIEGIDPFWAAPSDDGLELWPGAVEELRLDPARGEIVRPALAKRRFSFARGSGSRLATVYVLDRKADVEHVHTTVRRGPEAVETLGAAAVGGFLVDPLGLRGAHFLWLAAIADAVEVIHTSIDRHRTPASAVADAIERRLTA